MILPYDPDRTAKANCKRCGQVFFYEPIFVNEVDLAKSNETHCARCKDDIIAAELMIQTLNIEEERRAQVLRILPPALLPKALSPDHGTDLNHLTFNHAAWKLVNGWRPRRGTNWLGLIGPAGLCKTRCLGLLAERLIMQGNRLVWTSAFRLHEETTINLKAKNPALNESARAHLEQCKMAGWLIIDDLNVWSKEMEIAIFRILNHRRENILPTAFTSNLHPHQFRELLTSVNPEAFIGRLIEGTALFDFTRSTQPEIPNLT